MKISLLYIRILERVQPELPVFFSYQIAENRFLNSYKHFKPKIPHKLVVVNCATKPINADWDSCVSEYTTYCGLGSDCGTFQAVGSQLDCDLVICFNTIAYLWAHNWIDPFIAAAEKYGAGVYGPTASFESFPHLRTPCISFNPKIIGEYPMKVDTREKAALFEHGVSNFSLWAEYAGYPVRMVTPMGSFTRKMWRTPDNIFRRGTQSNCVVWDRHTDLYFSASNADKVNLERSADGKNR